MKIIAHRSQLLPAVKAAKAVIPSRNTIPILGNVLLRASGDGHVDVSGTDLDLLVTTRAECVRVDADGAVTLPAARLHDFLNALPESAEITVDTDPGGKAQNGQTRISAGRARINLSALPAQDFPLLEAVTPDADNAEIMTASLAGAALAAWLADVLPSVSNEEARYYLNGIFLDRSPVSDTRITAVATDGKTLMAREVEAETRWPDANHSGFIIPSRAIPALIKTGEAAGEETVTLALGATRFTMHADSVGTVITSKWIDGTYPDWRRVMPPDDAATPRLTANTADLAAALRLTKVASGGEAPVVLITLGDDVAIFAARDTGTGDSAEAEAACTIIEGGADWKLGIAPAYLDMILKTVGAGGAVSLGQAENGDPTLWRDPTKQPEDIQTRGVIMPMRV